MGIVIDIILAILVVGVLLVVGSRTIEYLERIKNVRRSDAYAEGMRSLIGGDYTTAFAKLKTAIREDPDNIDAYLQMGDLFRETGKLDRALQLHRAVLLRTGLSRSERNEAFKSLALDRVAQEQYELALEALQEANRLVKEDQWTIDMLFRVAVRLQRWPLAYKAQYDLQKLTARSDTPLLALLKAYTGKAVMESGDLHQARVLFKEALRINPACEPAHLWLGDAYAKEYRLDDAMQAWDRFLTACPARAYLAFERLERTYYQRGQYEKVEEVYRRLVEERPSDWRAQIALAHLEHRKGDHAGARDLAQRALNHPDAPLPAAVLLTTILMDQQDFGAARSLLETLPQYRESLASRWVCSKCGNTDTTVDWICPTCHGIDTIREVPPPPGRSDPTAD